MSKLILLRHGESVWNKWNVFTGWVDVPLSSKGIQEAIEAGKRIKEMPIDVIYTTPLIRASMTAMIAMSEHNPDHVPVILHQGQGQMEEWGKIYCKETKKRCIPVICDQRLNERMYGELQGYNKKETAKKFGSEQVKLWRRSFDTEPPGGESLAMTAARSVPYFEEEIVPHLDQGRNVLISAHGNSLRSIVMHLDGLSKEEVIALELPTGEPRVYDYQDGNFTRTHLD